MTLPVRASSEVNDRPLKLVDLFVSNGDAAILRRNKRTVAAGLKCCKPHTAGEVLNRVPWARARKRFKLEFRCKRFSVYLFRRCTRLAVHANK